MGAKAAAPAAPSSAKKRKPVVLDDSDNEDGTRRNGSNGKKKSPSKDASKSKKRRVIYSSDEDKPKTSKDKNNTVSSKVAKLKAVDVSNAFGSGPIKRVEKEKKSKNPKDLDVFDADTDDMELMKVDEELLSPKTKKKDSSKNEIKVNVEMKSPVKGKPVLKSKNIKTPEKVKTEQKSPQKVKTEKKTPIKKEKPSPDESKERSSKKKDSDDSSKKKTTNSTPVSNKKAKKSPDETMDLDQSVYDVDEEKHEKRRAAAMLYKQFQKRAGPSAPGSKEIPKGKSNCLAGLAFVLTGVYESMERDEASAVIKSFGGRVTSALSRKTNYIIAGDESGPAKLAKAEELNITILNEDDLLDLIREKSGMPTLKKKVKEEKTSPVKKEKKSPMEDKKEKRVHSPVKHESPKKQKVEDKSVKTEGII